jgi:tRNA(fMet)-specific endonuclease VapC
LKYLLDTDICIYMMQEDSPTLRKKFEAIEVGDVGISCISVCELQFGVENSRRMSENQRVLDRFLRDFEILGFDRGACQHYGKLRAALSKSGKPIGGLDMLIAAHALHLGARLVTNNTREFSRVPGLKAENWISA